MRTRPEVFPKGREPDADSGAGAAESVPAAPLAALAALAILSMGAAITLPGAALPQIRADLGWSMAAGGWLVGAYSIGFFVGLLAGGPLSDQGRFRAAFAVASVLFGGAWLLIGRSPWPAANYGLQFLAGVGGGMLQAAAGALVIAVYAHRAAGVLNLIHACVSVGTVGAPILLWAILRAGGDWRWAFAACTGGPLAVLGLSVVTRFPAAPGATRARPGGGVALLADRPFQLLAGAMVCYIAAEFAINVWLPTYLTSDAGFSDTVGKWTLSAFWVALAIGRIATATVMRRRDNVAILLALAIGALVTFAVALALGGRVWALGAFFAYGLALSGLFPTITAVCGLRYAGRSGTAIAAVAAVGCLSSAGMPPLVGAVAERTSIGLAMTLHLAFLAAMIGLLFLYRSVDGGVRGRA